MLAEPLPEDSSPPIFLKWNECTNKIVSFLKHSVLKRSTRTKIWQETFSILERGNYTNRKNQIVNLKNLHVASKDSYFFNEEDFALKYRKHKVRLQLFKKEAFEVAIDLVEQDFSPMIVNCADPEVPGGGYFRGATSEEAELFLCSSLAIALDFRLGYQKRNFYPFNEDGGVYSPNIWVFRDSDFEVLEKPIKIAVCSMSALLNPKIEKRDNKWWLSERDEKLLYKKLRKQFLMAQNHNHNAIVLNAFGCNSSFLPPNHVAKIYFQLIEKEFIGCFKRICFAVCDRGTSFFQGNVKAFTEKMEEVGGEIF